MPKKSVRIIGHRGFPAVAPENSLLSFEKAIKTGVDTLELDIHTHVHLSKDKELIVIHDNTVDRTTNGTGFVKHKTLKQLKKLNLGKGQKIPTLKEVVNHIDRRVILQIEIKDRGLARPLVAFIKKHKLHSHCYVSSFWHQEILNVKKLDPKIKTVCLFTAKPIDMKWMITSTKADAFSPKYPYFDKRFIDELHKYKKEVIVRSLNTQTETNHALDLGADVVSSDHCKNLIKFVQNYYRKKK